MGSSFGWQILRKGHNQLFRTRANARVHKPEKYKSQKYSTKNNTRNIFVVSGGKFREKDDVNDLLLSTSFFNSYSSFYGCPPFQRSTICS